MGKIGTIYRPFVAFSTEEATTQRKEGKKDTATDHVNMASMVGHTVCGMSAELVSKVII